MHNALKSRGGLRRVWNALRYSRRGLWAAVRHEAAFRQELALAAVLAPLLVWLPLSVIERLLLIGSVVAVLVVELLNSAIEAIADRVSTDHHELIGRAKDLGSAAVLLALLVAAITWGAIAGPPLLAALGF